MTGALSDARKVRREFSHFGTSIISSTAALKSCQFFSPSTGVYCKLKTEIPKQSPLLGRFG
jgi:hypothetical protein